MAYCKIGFLASGSGGNADGIGAYVQALADADISPVVFCNDGDVGISDAIATGKPFVAIGRIVRDGSEQYAVPDYDLSPKDAAEKHWAKIRPFFHPTWLAHKDKVWIQVVNEVNKEKAGWLGMFGVEIAMLANALGYKVAMFAWASGTPEPEAWQEPGMLAYLRYCEQNHDMAAVAVHEYDYGMEGMNNVYPYHVGRFEALFAACDTNGIKRPQVFITEFGWAYTSIPSLAQCMSDIDFAARLYAQYDEIKGAGIWYLGPGFSDIANKVNTLIEPVKNYTLETVLPDPQQGNDNMLMNPSFEEGFYLPGGVKELQIPNDWGFWYADESIPNPYDSEPWSVFVRPEVRTLHRGLLPPDEQPLFVLDGDYTLKIFKGSGSIYHGLAQVMPRGKWEMHVKVFPDLITGYDADGGKIFATHPDSCIVWVEVDGVRVGQEQRPAAGAWQELVFELDLPGDSAVAILFMQPFALNNNGLFLDDWELREVVDTCNAREPYNREVWVANPGMSQADYTALAALAYSMQKQTITFSYDDAGIGCGLGIKKAVLFNIAEARHQEFVDWYDTYYPGTVVEFMSFPPSNPYSPPVGQGEAGVWPGEWVDANPYLNRYLLAGSWAIHTGADLNLNSPVWNADNNAPVHAIADGIVIYSQLVINSNGQVSSWGRLVVIEHDDGVCSRYGHMRTLNVSAGQNVVMGQVIGTIGGTEYGLPDHLHFDISLSGILLSSPTYWPGDNLPAVQEHFVDPHAFIVSGR